MDNRLAVATAKRQAIERGILLPGVRLVEKDLCQQLGVSRTSLREALRELEAEGVVAQSPPRGLTVARISRRDAENIYRIRAKVEALIVEQFVRVAGEPQVETLLQLSRALVDAYLRGNFVDIVEAKRGFYSHICKVADNNIAFELLSRLTLRTAQLRSRSVARVDRQAESVKEIETLERAIVRRDIKVAHRAAKAHVEHAAKSALPFAGS